MDETHVIFESIIGLSTSPTSKGRKQETQFIFPRRRHKTPIRMFCGQLAAAVGDDRPAGSIQIQVECVYYTERTQVVDPTIPLLFVRIKSYFFSTSSVSWLCAGYLRVDKYNRRIRRGPRGKVISCPFSNFYWLAISCSGVALGMSLRSLNCESEL